MVLALNQISPAASSKGLHHTIWRTWLFIPVSDERWLHYCFSLLFSLKCWENVHFLAWEWKGHGCSVWPFFFRSHWFQIDSKLSMRAGVPPPLMGQRATGPNIRGPPPMGPPQGLNPRASLLGAPPGQMMRGPFGMQALNMRPPFGFQGNTIGNMQVL